MYVFNGVYIFSDMYIFNGIVGILNICNLTDCYVFQTKCEKWQVILLNQGGN